MAPSPLRPPTLEEAGEALAPIAPIVLAWPTVFDAPATVERAWLALIGTYGHPVRTTLRQALAFAQARHSQQRRRGSDTPYWVHLVRVALELARWGQATPVMIGAALLHDVVEDTPTTVGEVAEGFGDEVATLVDWMTAPAGRERAACAVYYDRLRREGPAAAHVLKLADRTDNLRSIQALVLRAGDRHRRWAATYLARTTEDVLPLAAGVPSIARVALVTAMADLASMIGEALTDT